MYEVKGEEPSDMCVSVSSVEIGPEEVYEMAASVINWYGLIITTRGAKANINELANPELGPCSH